jgi:hypothetical protein
MPSAARALPNERRRGVLQRLAIHPLFRRMAARQGIDLTAGWGRGQERLLRDALDRCAACAQPRSCQAWLATARQGPGYPSFCPNAEAIEACRIMDPDAFPLPGTGRLSAHALRLKEALADPLVQQVMRADRRNTLRLLAVLSGTPRRLIERLATAPGGRR